MAVPKPENFEHSQFHPMASWRGSIEDMTICPYNPNHVMTYGQLQIHIVSCQKIFEQEHPELAKDFVICDYSSIHRFPKDKREDHLKECKEYMMSVYSRFTAGKGPVDQLQPLPPQVMEGNKSEEE